MPGPLSDGRIRWQPRVRRGDQQLRGERGGLLLHQEATPGD